MKTAQIVNRRYLRRAMVDVVARRSETLGLGEGGGPRAQREEAFVYEGDMSRRVVLSNTVGAE